MTNKWHENILVSRSGRAGRMSNAFWISAVAIPNHLLHLRLSLFCLDISLPFGCFSILLKLSNGSTLYLLLQKASSYTCNTVLFRCRSFRSVCKTRSAQFLARNRRNLDQTPSITHPLLH